MDLHDIREDYSKQALSKKQCDPDPMVQFERWLNEAMSAKVNEPTAMTISTVGENGRPSSRVVLLKEVRCGNLVFFTNYHSHKGRDLEVNPVIAVNFFWPELERQVRIEGTVEKLAPELSDEYFQSRPYTSRVGAWASNQSEILSSKQALIAKATLIAAKHPLNVPRPPHWGGFVIKPDLVEFWQGRPSRLHDRIRYQLDNGNWQLDRLSP